FGRKKKTTEEIEKEVDIIKQIEAEVERLEKQWEQMEKEFALVNVDIYSPGSDTGEADYYPPSWLYSPNKHFKKLWHNFVKIHKKILTLEHYANLLRKTKPDRGRREKRIIMKLSGIIRYKENEVVINLSKEINTFEKAIEEARRKEAKYMEKLYNLWC
ncbi:MAG: hypothetical protein QG641_1347, partial [Candidatus Poribacteria bacterium]|nr:hypothetical protein [Candidatus Poribacteria bacterium]